MDSINNIEIKNDKMRNELYSIETNLRMKQRKKALVLRLLNLYQYFGLIIAIFSFIYFSYSIIEKLLSETQKIVLFMGGIGLSLSLVSWFTKKINQKNKNDSEAYSGKVTNTINYISTWIMFEDILNQVQTDNNRHSIKERINGLYEKNILNANELYFLERAIWIRNNIIHKGEIVSDNELQYLIVFINGIIDKIRRSVLTTAST